MLPGMLGSITGQLLDGGDSTFELQLGGLVGKAFKVLSFRGTEAMSELFDFEAASTSHPADEHAPLKPIDADRRRSS